MSDMIKRATDAMAAMEPGVSTAYFENAARAALLAALDLEDEALRDMLKHKVGVHYWNHHGAREPSPEFVDDLVGMIVIGLRDLVQPGVDVVQGGTNP